jgi:hypothetical protein
VAGRGLVVIGKEKQVQVWSEKTPNLRSRKFQAVIVEVDIDDPSQPLPELDEKEFDSGSDDSKSGEKEKVETILPEAYGTGMQINREDKMEIARSPLAQALFELDFVGSLFLGRDFVTVTKNTSEPWRYIANSVEGKLQSFFLSGKPTIEDQPARSDTAILPTDSEVVATIKELMETRVRPSVQEDGGDIFYEGFDEATGESFVYKTHECCRSKWWFRHLSVQYLSVHVLWLGRLGFLLYTHSQ